MKEFRPLISLYGREYDTVKDLVLFSVAGNALKSNLIKIGSIYEDLRINAMIIMKSGYGKRALKMFVKETQACLGKSVTEPTSLHPEQLVGRVVTQLDMQGNIVDYVPILGYLSEDFLIFEEALDLVVSREYETARSYINVALDPIGQNLITKRMVDVPAEKAIKYTPNCSMIFMMQPASMPPTVMYRGLMRRLFVGYISFVSDKSREEALVNSLKYQPDISLWNRWLGMLDRLSKSKFIWETDDRALVDLTKKLIIMGREYSVKGRELTNMLYFTLMHRLLKAGCVIAAMRNSSFVSEDDLGEAFDYVRRWWLSQLQFVEEYIPMFPKSELFNNIEEILRRGPVKIESLVTELIARGFSKGLIYSYLENLINAGELIRVEDRVMLKV
jgi:hypothetical protein